MYRHHSGVEREKLFEKEDRRGGSVYIIKRIFSLLEYLLLHNNVRQFLVPTGTSHH